MKKFGTFKGVFTPSILTILGVIMYLRLGWVLGNVGIISTLMIVSMCTAITFLTSLSMSALATNMKVGAGGAYYMISRSLGLETGAAIGIWLYMSLALGISFYIVGFVESLSWLIPGLPEKIVGLGVLIFLTLLTLRSTNLALKIQYIILALIILSLISFFLGNSSNINPVIDQVKSFDKKSFWYVFAVFFPAVTGIEAGLGMSGDLENPSRSLPKGTLLAIVISYVIYITIPIFLNNIISDKQILISQSLIMVNVARWGVLIYLGIWGATISSAIGSLLVAPRTLQAIAKDKILPNIFAKGSGITNEPRNAIFISFVIAMTGILLGDLDIIAPILTMFFLTSYGLLNISAAIEILIGSPSWRPTFKVYWILPFIGAFLCFSVMFMINPGATFMAIFVSIVTFIIIQRRQLSVHWKDTRFGLYSLLAQYFIHKLEERNADAHTWSPNILALTGNPSSRWHLINFASNITRKRGVITVAAVLDQNSVPGRRYESEKMIKSFLKNEKVKGLVKVVSANSLYDGSELLLQAYGLGEVRPNTLLLGDAGESNNYLEHAKIMKTCVQQLRNLLIIKEGNETSIEKNIKIIDIWHGPQSPNINLMLALAYLLWSSPWGQNSSLRIFRIIDNENDINAAKQGLINFYQECRLQVEVNIVVQNNPDPIQALTEHSNDSDFIFYGMRKPDEEESDESDENYANYYKNLLDEIKHFPHMGLVLTGESIDFREIFQ